MRYATSWKVAGSNPYEAILFLISLSNHSSLTMALGLTQPITEMSTGNLTGGGNAQLAHKAVSLIAICEAII
jgi:hypothetical protein